MCAQVIRTHSRRGIQAEFGFSHKLNRGRPGDETSRLLELSFDSLNHRSLEGKVDNP